MRLFRHIAPGALACLLALPASAQDNALVIDQTNRLFVEQDGLRNQITVDQSDATGSLIGSSETPISQSGRDNLLTITDAGVANVISAATQLNPVDGDALLGNIARITIDRGVSRATVSVVQSVAANAPLVGGDNVAVIGLASGAGASIRQLGSDNTATLLVRGNPGSVGRIEQTGSGNVGGLIVEGSGPNANVTLSQTGTGLNSADAAVAGTGTADGSIPGGISVITNGPVTIRQSNL